MTERAYLIAEVGCTHISDMERAKKLIDLAAQAGADCVKFQKRNPIESVPKAMQDQPHPNKSFSYGKTYLEHRQNLELTVQQHEQLKRYCESAGVDYSTSVWDITSAKEIAKLEPKMIKVPSACNQDLDLIYTVFEKFKCPIHISMGMTTCQERAIMLGRYTERSVLYHCTSGYPVPFDKMYLKEISFLQEQLRDGQDIGIGFSNHGYGIMLEPVAYALGARYFERHFIDDRAFPHSDSAASVEPQGLQKIRRDLDALQKAMQYKPDELDEIELEQRNKLRV